MMLLMRIERWDVRRDGALSEASLQQKLQALGYDATPQSYPVGPTASPHTDGRERMQAVVTGLVKVTVDGESAILTAGDAVYVPRGAVRRLHVIGTAPARCLEAVFRSN